jgi:hypothetical protein
MCRLPFERLQYQCWLHSAFISSISPGIVALAWHNSGHSEFCSLKLGQGGDVTVRKKASALLAALFQTFHAELSEMRTTRKKENCHSSETGQQETRPLRHVAGEKSRLSERNDVNE